MKFLLTLSFISSCFLASAQCCPYINSVEILPAVPTITDNIKIVTTVTTANQGQFIFSSHTIVGNTIEIESCYYNGLLTATQTYYDTLELGLLPAGTYTIDFTAFESADTVCTYSDSSSSNSSFSLIDGPSGLNSQVKDIGRLYPNPNTGTFYLDVPNHLNANRIEITSISGEVVYRGGFSSKIATNLQSGMYFVALFEDEIMLGTNRLIVD